MRKFFTKKKIAAAVVIVLVVGFFIFRSGKTDTSNIQTENVKKQDLKKTVLASGTVVSGVDLALSFKTSGVVSQLPASVGKKVRSGEVLAMLSNGAEAAALTQARGALAGAQANLRKVIDGASSEDVHVSEKAVSAAQVTLYNAKNALESTKTQYSVATKNAFTTLLNSTLSAFPASTNYTQTNPTVSGTYSWDQQGEYKVTLVAVNSNFFYTYNGLESGSQPVSAFGAPTPLGTKGLYLTFSGLTPGSNGDSWTISVPNTKATSYVTNLSGYNAAVEAEKTAVANAQNTVASAQASLDQANAGLALKKAQARPAEVAAAQAQVLQAQGQVQAAAANYENTVLRAPADGTITLVDIKLGEQAQALKGIIKLQNLSSLHVESFISEANVAVLKQGQKVSYTFDAFGSDKKFEGVLVTVDPASVVQSGVVNYKVVSSLPSIPELKPGLTANLTVLIDERQAVLAVPSRAVTEQSGKKTIKVITNTKEKTYEEKEVTTGLEDSSGLIEITSGLSENEEIVILIKK
ncbi:MAG TPA: efflux RND transporter periplasmic adaptor subunit [Patescibacteria group bacterium]|nr:efflux RND transporter periplasmic adaptor subunit [Patescibacteria group bacterium]